MPQIEIAIQLTVDPRQQIQVESRCHADRIIIGGQDLRHRLDQVRPQKKRVTRTKQGADLAQELLRRAALEIADRAAEEQHEQGLAAATPGHFSQPVGVGALDLHDVDRVDRA